MIRETFRRLAIAVSGIASWGQAPALPDAPATFSPLSQTAPRVLSERTDAYANCIPGSGPGESARRRRAMRRTAKPEPNIMAYRTIHGTRTAKAVREMEL